MKRLIPVIMSIGLLWTAGLGSLWVATPVAEDDLPDRINLALRQVGHQLLNVEGDSVSPIPPVEQVGTAEYRLNLVQGFNYDTLPNLLNKAFSSYSITEPYHVSVERCEDNLVMLGYNHEAFQRGEVACKGREQTLECSNIVITFGKAAPVRSGAGGFIIAGLLLLTGLVIAFSLVRRRKSDESLVGQKHVETYSGVATDAQQISIGKFVLDHQNQSLYLNGRKKDLTFRESKLLHYLAQHINEVQSRDMLIDSVWADEGVLVGRSLDVFISRLRKLLKGDDRVSIRSIHGVGYRLEVVQA